MTAPRLHRPHRRLREPLGAFRGEARSAAGRCVCRVWPGCGGPGRCGVEARRRVCPRAPLQPVADRGLGGGRGARGAARRSDGQDETARRGQPAAGRRRRRGTRRGGGGGARVQGGADGAVGGGDGGGARAGCREPSRRRERRGCSSGGCGAPRPGPHSPDGTFPRHSPTQHTFPSAQRYGTAPRHSPTQHAAARAQPHTARSSARTAQPHPQTSPHPQRNTPARAHACDVSAGARVGAAPRGEQARTGRGCGQAAGPRGGRAGREPLPCTGDLATRDASRDL